jgi:hypothetical protein
VDYVETLAVAALRLRLAGIAQWHIDQSFPDPIKAPVVRKVLRGVAELHPATEKQAQPLQLSQLQQLQEQSNGYSVKANGPEGCGAHL